MMDKILRIGNKGSNNKGFYGILKKGKWQMHANTNGTNFQEIAGLLALHEGIGKILRKRLYALLGGKNE